MNLSALVTLLDTDARYDAAVRGGDNGAVLRLLVAVDAAAPRRWRPVSVDDFLNAIAGETLTPTQEDRIRTYTQQRATVPVHLAAVRTWIQAQGWAASTIAALRALAEVPGRYCDPLLTPEEDTVSLADVRAAVRQIAKSLVAARESAERMSSAARYDRMVAAAQADAAWLAANPTLSWEQHPILQATSAQNAEEKANV